MRSISRREALGRLAAVLGGLAFPLACPGALFAQSAFEYNLKGQKLLVEGKIEEAVKILRKAVAEDDRNERSWGLLARAYAAQGDPGSALACYRQALVINPRDSLTRMMVDILSQNPIPKPKNPALARQANKGGRPSELEKAAEAERRAAMSGALEAAASAGKPWRLVLDPGHGGEDFGCEAGGGLYEKQIALDISLRMAKELYALCPDAEIHLTRLGDYAVPGYVRALCASLYGADLFVSVHASCSKEAARNGLAVYSSAEKSSNDAAGETAALENRALAVSGAGNLAGSSRSLPQILLGRRALIRRREQGAKAAEAFAGKLPVADLGAGLRMEEGPFDILDAVEAPAFLVEAGMVSNAGDVGRLGSADKRQELAKIFARSLKDAFGCGGQG